MNDSDRSLLMGGSIMKKLIYPGLMISLAILLVLLVIGCGGEGKTEAPSDDHDGSTVTITIGNITDLTGPGANGMELVNTALDDIASYYNDNRLIPGVEFKVIHFDGQMDPSRTIPGYEWLKQRGADVMTTCAPGVAITLKPRVNADRMALFSQVGELEAIEPPGYVFCLGAIPQYEAYTLLNWIAENDWDYEKNGPARIGMAAWAEPYAIDFLQAMKRYTEVHPDQFELAGSYLKDFTFIWTSEAQLLKDCDYVFPPILMQGFARDIRDAGSEARFIGGAAHTAFFPQISDAGAWPLIDGMLFIFTGAWWNEDADEVEFNKMLLNQYHPGELDEITRQAGYGSLTQYRAMFDLIARTVATTGPEGFDSEALYETAQSWSYAWGYKGDYDFSPTKRYMVTDLCVQEASAREQDLVRNDPNYYPILTEP